MKIGILQCDSVLAEYQAEFGDYPQMIIKMFEAITDELNFKLVFQVYNIIDNEYPEDLDECDVYITTGSKASVYDDLVWINPLKQFIRDLDVAHKKLVGICFGHQLIADALGGKTRPSAEGWGVGLSRNKMVTHKTWMKPPLAELKIIVSHKDQVAILPTCSELLAASDFCPHFMYQIGDHIMCIQGHPEFLPGYSETLMGHRRKILGESVYQAGVSSLRIAPDDKIFTHWMLNFFNAS